MPSWVMIYTCISDAGRAIKKVSGMAKQLSRGGQNTESS